jgi:hypothetical protein
MNKLYVDDTGSLYSVHTEEGAGTQPVIKVYFSRLGDTWSEAYRGKLAAKLVDDGNGVLIKVGGKTLCMDYSAFAELQLLLQVHSEIEAPLRFREVVTG